MKMKKCLIIHCSLFFLLGLLILAPSNIEARSNTIDSTVTSIKKGWEKKGSSYYYWKKGQLVRSKVIKIGKYYYGFDKNGRSIRGKKKQFRNYNYEFDKKGRALKREKPNAAGGVVCQIYQNGIFKYDGYYENFYVLRSYKNKSGDINYVCVKVRNPSIYTELDFAHQDIKSKLYDSNGNKISPKRIKCGSIIRLYHEEGTMMIPVQYSINKIELLYTP